MKKGTDINSIYASALELYTTTRLTQKEICIRCGVSVSGFRSYLQKFCRRQLFERYGADSLIKDEERNKMHGKNGQGVLARHKYGAAIMACNSKQYLKYSVSYIARMFNLSASALSNQLHMHHPEILARRQEMRNELGYSTVTARSARQASIKKYDKAVEMMRNTDNTVDEIARRCGVSASGLIQYTESYHKDVLEKRIDKSEERQKERRNDKRAGKYKPREKTVLKYAEAMKLYDNTAMTIKEIVEACDVTENGFSCYLRKWHRDKILLRRGVSSEGNAGASDLSDTKHYRKSTRWKYKDAIDELRQGSLSMSEVARNHHFSVQGFRQYLKEHEPELLSRYGMTDNDSGRKMLRRSYDKYKDALMIYQNTTRSLRSIALDMQLSYNSLREFVIKHYPMLIEMHKKNRGR